MRMILALAVALLAGTLAFGQSTHDDRNDPLDIVLEHANDVLDRAGQVLDRALHELEGGLDGESDRPARLQFEEEPERHFVPFQISFVPGISLPFGYYDVGLSYGAVGALTRDITGVGGAGVFNISRDIMGAQLAGVFNLSRDVAGIQAAGVFNIAHGSLHGAQFGGVFNISGDVNGFQGAGVFNIAEDFRGPMQSAGVFNIARDLAGGQLAGVFNIAEQVRGVQASSVVNVAKDVRGVQIGLVNIADTIEGVQLGLVNLARNGVGGLGFSYEPYTGYGWAWWQNGTRQLYTLFMVGGMNDPSVVGWSFRPDSLVVSGGLGSRLNLHVAWIDLELAVLKDLGPGAAWLSTSTHIAGRGGYGSESTSAEFFNDLGYAATLVGGYPWPSVKLTLGVPVLWRLTLVGGIRFDFDVRNWSGVPDRMKNGMTATGLNLFGLVFDSYGKWFIGIKI